MTALLEPLRHAAVALLRRRAAQGERGVTMVIFAVAIVIILGMVAIGIDLSSGFDERRQAQNASDNAAMSAAQASCGGATLAVAQAAGLSSANVNGYDNDGTSNTVTIGLAPGSTAGDHKFQATVRTTIGTFFGGILGVDDLTTTTLATAQATNCGAGGPLTHAIFSGGPCDSGKGLRLAGSDMTVIGGVHTNGSSQQSGSNSEYGDTTAPVDPYTYAIASGSSFTFPTNTFEMNPPQVVASKPWPTGWAQADADALRAQYLAFVDNPAIPAALRHKVGTPTDITGDGVWYSTSTAKWTINSVPANAKIVIVTAGQIEWGMDGSDISAFEHPDLPRDNILMLSTVVHSPVSKGCDEFSIAIPKTDVDWNGVLWAPRGLVTINGGGMSNANTSRGEGAILSYATKIEGQYVEIRFDPDLALAEPDVLLIH